MHTTPENAMSIDIKRPYDISSWQDVDISSLSTKAKKRFRKRKAAVTAYLSGEQPINELAEHYRLLPAQLQELTAKCLMQHEDGQAWGFRALLPGIEVTDYTDQVAAITFAAITRDQHQPNVHNSLPTLPETPRPVSGPDPEMEQTPAEIEAVTAEEAAPEPTQKLPAIKQNELAEEAEDTPTQTLVEAASEEAASQPVADEQAQAVDEETAPTDPLPPTVVTTESTESAEAVDASTVEQAPATTDEESTQTLTPPQETVADETEDALVSEIAQPALEEEQATASLTEPTINEADSTSEGKPVVTDADSTAEAEQQETVPLADQTIQKDEAITDAIVEPAAEQQEAEGTPAEVVEAPQATKSSPLPKIAALVSAGQALQKYRQHPAVAQQAATLKNIFFREKGAARPRFKTKRARLLAAISLTLVLILGLTALIPLSVGFEAYNLYGQVNSIAHDGINHLLSVKDLLASAKKDPMSALDPNKLKQSQQSLKDAEKDFLSLQQLLDRQDLQSAVNQYASSYTPKIASAQHLVTVAIDVARMGQELTGVGMIASRAIHGSPLASSSAQPLISVQDMATIKAAMTHSLYYLDDIQQNMTHVNLNGLPMSKSQKAQLTGLLTQLPQARSLLNQALDLSPSLGWLLGIGQSRRFLVQTMDRGELRPSGGFTGQYGVLQIDNGRMAPLSLRDVALLDYAGNGMELGRSAPPEYSSWMNFGNWGLRDSNLSGDYPTTARLSMRVFQEEGGGPVDGDISFTPTFIAHILNITGPIHIAEYNETITAKNLEDRLHYYQQDFTAIAKEQQLAKDTSHQARKAFTSLVGKMLLDKVRHLPTSKLIEVIKNATKDIQSRDLEIYFTDPQAEQWLTDHGYSGAMNSFNKTDGFMLVQSNISISKASQYVHTIEQDNIVLDKSGGATHNLTITLDYNQTGPVYGFDTYADYMRLYAPGSSRYIDGYGFDSGNALCKPTPPSTKPPKGQNPPNGNGDTGGANGNGDSSTNCKQYDTYFPDNARYCPSGIYALGDRNFQMPWSIDSLGAPTNMSSDLPGRQMWGGLTVTPKNCDSTITFSWYVPHAVKYSHGHPSYQLIVGKQGGYIPTIQISVDTQAIKGLKPLHVKKDIVADTQFSTP